MYISVSYVYFSALLFSAQICRAAAPRLCSTFHNIFFDMFSTFVPFFLRVAMYFGLFQLAKKMRCGGEVKSCTLRF